MIRFKLLIKRFLKKNLPNVFDIASIFYNQILLKKKNNTKFSGLGFKSSTSLPWDGISKNKTSQGFIDAKKKIVEKIKSKEFYLAQLENYDENVIFEDILNHFEELDYRHYHVYYSAIMAFENTKSRNIVECGVGAGMSAFFCISYYKKDKTSKLYLYDSWEAMREKELKNKKDLERIGSYGYLNLDMIKKNLKDFSNHVIYNKGFIPQSFENSISPEQLSWLHIDLDSSMPTLEALKFFYPKLEKNGVVLINTYGFDGYENTRNAVEGFFKDRKVHFLQLMTGQALVVKKE